MITPSLGSLLDLNDNGTLYRLGSIGGEITSAASKWRLSLMYDRLAEVVVPMSKQRDRIYLKRCDLKNNLWILKEGFKQDDHNQEMDAFRAEKIDLLVQPFPLETFEGTSLTVKDISLLVKAGLAITPTE